MQGVVAQVSCVPFPWVSIVVGAMATVIGVLAGAVNSVYRRMNRISEEATYRLEMELAEERRRRR